MSDEIKTVQAPKTGQSRGSVVIAGAGAMQCPKNHACLVSCERIPLHDIVHWNGYYYSGLAGLSAAKHLCDRGYTPFVLESRDVLGGKVSKPHAQARLQCKIMLAYANVRDILSKSMVEVVG
jgi:hypothetical protein